MRFPKAVCLCLLLLFSSTAADAKIVFGAQHDGIYGIYMMDDDGSNITPLTESETLRPFLPCWSPDGKQIVFKKRATAFDTKSVLFLMNADGTNVRQLTENDGSTLGSPSFSPDSTALVFDRSFRINDTTLKYGIYVLNIKTGKMKEIAAQLMASTCDWSPDGKHIIFSEWIAGGGGGGTIWIIGADGHNPRQFLPAPPMGELVIHRSSPCWSPDGKQIAFIQREYTWERIPNVGNALVYHAHRYLICDRKGENIRKLRIPKDWKGFGIDWMDDGKSIVFSAREGMPLNEPIPPGFLFPPSNIYKYHLQTNNIARLTDLPGWTQTVDWINDKGLFVSPVGKEKVTWGQLKQPSRK